MNITRIANLISEQVGARPQDLLNSYVESVGVVEFTAFSNCCAAQGITITEDSFADLLADNDRYLFTESDDGWIAALLDCLEESLEL